MMKNNKKMTFLLIFLFSIFVAFAIPTDPNIFYGRVTLNDDSDVDGTLKLYVNDVLQDTISVNDGSFGGAGVFDSKLTATGKNGDTIKFVLVVEDYEIDPITQLYEEGNVEEINLAFEGEQVNVTRRIVQSENQTLEDELKDVIIDEIAEILQKYNLSGSPEDLEIESKETIYHTSELTQGEIDDLTNVIDEDTLSKLEQVLKSGARIVVETQSKYYKVRDKKSGKSIHILDIKSSAKIENVEAGNIVWIENIPKSIAEHVSSIHFVTSPDEIINPDPVIRFVIPYNPEQEVYSIEYKAVTEDENAKDDVKNIKHIIIPETKEEVTTTIPQEQPPSIETEKHEEQPGEEQESTEKTKTEISSMLLILLGLIIVAVLLFWVLIKLSKKRKK
ncbi:MAG: hypothetical protein ACTSX1_15690 [Candidatus Heimdallarchaeaceae archaeon]